MATMKDVAKLANVSVGSVSNVINGKTNNVELIQKVEKAITELNFKPSEKARILKSSQSFLVGIIINNTSINGMFTILSVIEQTLNIHGYSLIIKSTDNNAILERKNIESFIQLGVDGIIVDTNVKNRKWLSLIKKENIPVVFMEQQPIYNQEINQICVDYEKGIQELLDWCVRKNLHNINMIFYDDMISNTKLDNLCQKNNNLRISYQITGKNASMNGFKTAYEVLYNNKKNELFDLILSGSPELFKGVKKALDCLGYAQSTKLVCIKNENWIEDSHTYDAILNVSFKSIAENAANLLLEKMRSKNIYDVETKNISVTFKECSSIMNNNYLQPKTHSQIRVAMLDSDIAHILPKVAEIYIRKFNINIEFIPFSYHELCKLSESPKELINKNIDLLMYDIIWKDFLIKNKILEKIPFTPKEYENYIEGYIDSIFNNYKTVSKEIYGLPLLTGTQLLFYQRDLFKDLTIKRRFFQQYGYELTVPQTWNQFLNIAEYFTRTYNPISPVKYGTSLINTGNLYNSIEFLNILWEMNTDIIMNHKFNIKNLYVKNTLKKYKRAYQYTNQKKCNSWEDIAQQFKEGETAMAILYDSYAYGINDPSLSKVAGNIESALIPGKISVLGGWGLGCTSNSDNKEIAFNFLKWICGSDGNRVFSVLAGISSRKDFYLNHDLDILYPWKKNIIKSYSLARMRNILEPTKNTNINMVFYDKILGKIIGKIIRNDIDIDLGINEIENALNSFNKNNK